MTVEENGNMLTVCVCLYASVWTPTVPAGRSLVPLEATLLPAVRLLIGLLKAHTNI